MTKLDFIIINYVKDTYHHIHNFLFMNTFGFPVNLFFFGAILISFVIYQLEHNQRVKIFLQNLAERDLLKYVTLGFIILIVLIMSI